MEIKIESHLFAEKPVGDNPLTAVPLIKLLTACFILFGLLFDPEDGNSTSVRNVGELLLHYIASYPRRY
jgi:hypothetical protein